MPPSKREAGTFGLRLTLPGAPHTWHHLPDHGVWVHPVHPTPCGGPLELTVEVAERLAKDPNVYVEMVDIADVARARMEHDNHLRAVRGLPPHTDATGFEGAALEAQTTKMEA